MPTRWLATGGAWAAWLPSVAAARRIRAVDAPPRTPRGPSEFKKMTPVAKKLAATIRAAHSLPDVVDPEIVEPTVWLLQYSVPFTLFEAHVGPLENVHGQTWRGNFYKCADRCSHPHWTSWAPLDVVNFHLPKCFAPIRFD